MNFDLLNLFQTSKVDLCATVSIDMFMYHCAVFYSYHLDWPPYIILLGVKIGTCSILGEETNLQSMCDSVLFYKFIFRRNPYFMKFPPV